MAANQVTHGGSGAGGLGNTRAWVRMQDPAGGREFTIQRTTADTTFRIKYSKLAKFTTGSPDATTTPSAADEGVVKGAGTDASPTGVAILPIANSRHHCMAVDSGQFPFYMASYPVGGGNCNGIFCMDSVTPFAGALDTDTVVIVCGISVNNLNLTDLVLASSANASCFGFMSTTFTAMRILTIAGSNASSGYNGAAMATNPYSGEDNLVPTLPSRYGTDAAPNGTKGTCDNIFIGPVSRASGDTYSVATARDRIVLMGSWCVTIPFNGDVPLV